MLPYGHISHHTEMLASQWPFYHGPFGRIFRSLPLWIPNGKTEAEQTTAIENLAREMLETLEQSDDTRLNNSMIPAGYTYFGQWIDHDITFDPTSELQWRHAPHKLHNFRTPRLGLDSLYGNGPLHSPYMYDQHLQDRNGFTGFLLTGRGEDVAVEDLPRNAQGRALISDPRNDENIIISQLHLGLIKFHNQVMAALEAEGIGGMQAFTEAQRIVRWHYQWVVIHDFLRRLIRQPLMEKLFPVTEHRRTVNLSFYRWTVHPFIPLEFSAAAYRMWHSMVRSNYVLNDALEEIRDNVGAGGRIPIILPPQDNPGPLADLRGGRFLPRFWTIQWDRFLKFEDHDGTTSTLQKSRKINTKLAFRLGAIPTGPDSQSSLALLNLKQGWRLGVPSGQHVSRAIGIEPRYNPHGHDPLWYYILQEAALDGGEHLGQVGGTLIAEVFLGLLAGDPLSYLNIDPTWEPKNEVVLPIVKADDENFQLRDILRFAKVPITKEDIETIVS